jgi:hypothetical protein
MGDSGIYFLIPQEAHSQADQKGDCIAFHTCSDVLRGVKSPYPVVVDCR